MTDHTPAEAGTDLAALRTAVDGLDRADMDETIGDYTREIAIVTAYVNRLDSTAALRAEQ